LDSQRIVGGTQQFWKPGPQRAARTPFKQWDLALYKNTKINERLSVQLRADFFNILNHPNFSSPLLPSFIADPASNVNQVYLRVRICGER